MLKLKTIDVPWMISPSSSCLSLFVNEEEGSANVSLTGFFGKHNDNYFFKRENNHWIFSSYRNGQNIDSSDKISQYVQVVIDFQSVSEVKLHIANLIELVLEPYGWKKIHF